MQACALVLAVAAGCGRLVEADVLAAAGIGDQSWFELLDPVAVGVDHRRSDALLRLVVAEDYGGDASLGLLADYLGHLVIVEITKGADDRRAPGNAARLRALLLVDMGDFARRDRPALQAVLQGAIGVARMLGMEPVGSTLAERIELDPLHQPSGAKRTGFGGVEEVGLQHLQLQRDGKAVCGAAQATAHQHFAGLDHLTADQRLKPVEVELAIGVALRRPALEQRVDAAVQRLVPAGGTRHDARANDVVHQHRHRLGCVRVVADQVAHAVAQ